MLSKATDFNFFFIKLVAASVPSRGNSAIYGRQWDNYPNDFNILRNRISLIINLPKKKHVSNKKKHVFKQN